MRGFFEPKHTGGSLLGGNAAPAEKFLEFREAFWKSGTPSVDAFLKGRPEFLDVGKFAIAYCLIPYESEKNLYEPPEPDGDWYLHLSERLNPSFDEFEHNKLSIVTHSIMTDPSNTTFSLHC